MEAFWLDMLGDGHLTETDSVNITSLNIAMNGQTLASGHNYTGPAQPAEDVVWRGIFKISNKNINMNLAAHLSSQQCLTAWETVHKMPNLLCLEMLPRVDVWPETFTNSQPTNDDIALYFFPESGRDEQVFDNLVAEVVQHDLALKVLVGERELLVFTCLQLPRKNQRYKGKLLYLCGIFRGNQISVSRELVGPPATLKVQNQGSKGAVKKSSVAPVKKVKQVDAGWEHAIPFGGNRFGTVCKYCQLLSFGGGITRLKTHLAGGNPRRSIAGCPNVPPDVKIDMAAWLNERQKKLPNTHKAAAPSKKVKQVGIEFEDSRQTTCKDCQILTLDRGHAHLKAHLSGGIHRQHLKGCPHMLSKDRSVVAALSEEKAKEKVVQEGDHNVREDSEVAPTKKVKHADVGWKHAIPLDRNRFGTICKYCHFLSLGGGITRLKTHLAGGDPAQGLNGCPHVSSEVKSIMAAWLNERAKKAKTARRGEIREESEGVDEQDRVLEADMHMESTPLTMGSVELGCQQNTTGPAPAGYDDIPDAPSLGIQECTAQPAGVTGELQAVSAGAAPAKRGRPVDSAWEHALPYNETKFGTKCRYCHLVSSIGGITRLKVHLGEFSKKKTKVHLGGGDPARYIKGCPNVPPEIKRIMAIWSNRSMKGKKRQTDS